MAEGVRALKARLKQARESLEEAKDLLVQDAAVNFVMNSLYYSFLYAMYGLLEMRGHAISAQSAAIALFEREYIQTGMMEAAFIEAIRSAFDLRPACDCEGKKNATVEDAERLLPLAEEFLHKAEELARTPGRSS